MKIFFFITKSEQGGAQTHVAQLTKYLVKNGHEITVMSAPDGWLQTTTENLRATFLPNPALGNTANPFRLIVAARTFLQAVQKMEPDIVACHSTMAGLIGRLALRNRVPTVFTAHGWCFTDGAKWYRRFLLPIIERAAARYCSKIICVSRNDLQLAKRHMLIDFHDRENLSTYRDPSCVLIYNGVEIASSFDRLRARNDRTEILFIGRLAEPKDPFLLLEALPENCHLTIVGDGPQKDRLAMIIKKRNLSNRISLAGALPHEEVINLLQNADILVLPTRYEGLPYTILEAMTHGVPVVASDVGGVREAVGDDAGILVPPNDVQALAEALERLIGDPELRARMGAAGRRKTETQFSLETMCERTFEVYRSVL